MKQGQNCGGKCNYIWSRLNQSVPHDHCIENESTTALGNDSIWWHLSKARQGAFVWQSHIDCTLQHILLLLVLMSQECSKFKKETHMVYDGTPCAFQWIRLCRQFYVVAWGITNKSINIELFIWANDCYWCSFKKNSKHLF